MIRKLKYLNSAIVAIALAAAPLTASAVSLSYVGTDYDIGGTFFPGGTAPYVVVPWRTASETFPKPLDGDKNEVYGSAGYALFATQFLWPNTTCCGSNPTFDSLSPYPNKIQLPTFVENSLNLVPNKTGGWNYALVDDPELVNGYRDFNWGDTLTPPVDPPHSQSPYVKIGIIQGNDAFGNNPKTSPDGAGRWAFTVDDNAPRRFRVGVMTDGLDGTQWAATEVLLHQVSGTSILQTATTATVVRNRFVDMHLFDIIGAQPGDTFAIFAKAPPVGDGNGGISGVTFDVYVPEPAGAVLVTIGAMALAFVRRRGNR